MIVSLSHLHDLNVCRLDERIKEFTDLHGHPPGERSTVAEWFAVTPDLYDRIWWVQESPGFWRRKWAKPTARACAEIAVLCGEAVLPVWEQRNGGRQPHQAVEAARAALTHRRTPKKLFALGRKTDPDGRGFAEERAAAAAACVVGAWRDVGARIAVAHYAQSAAWFAAISGADLTRARARLDTMIAELEAESLASQVGVLTP